MLKIIMRNIFILFLTVVVGYAAYSVGKYITKRKYEDILRVKQGHITKLEDNLRLVRAEVVDSKTMVSNLSKELEHYQDIYNRDTEYLLKCNLELSEQLEKAKQESYYDTEEGKWHWRVEWTKRGGGYAEGWVPGNEASVFFNEWVIENLVIGIDDKGELWLQSPSEFKVNNITFLKAKVPWYKKIHLSFGPVILRDNEQFHLGATVGLTLGTKWRSSFIVSDAGSGLMIERVLF